MEFNSKQKNAINSTDAKILCLASAGSGKAIPVYTLLPTPSGSRKAKEIKIGDYLFDRNGNPTKVTGVYPQGEKEVYEITFEDGRKAQCCEEHLWAVNKSTYKNKNHFYTISLRKLLEEKLACSDEEVKFYIPTSKPVQYKEKEYNIHPYLIGAFLGQGSCSESYLTLFSENEEIPNIICELIDAQCSSTNGNWVFKNKHGQYLKTKDLPEEIVCKNYKKSVPSAYKYGTIEQRLELVRGLMDTNGTITLTKNTDGTSIQANIKFTSESSQLIKDLKEVLGSLGYVSTMIVEIRNTDNVCYRLDIDIPNNEKYKIFRLSTKKETALSIKDIKTHRLYDRTSIKDIKKLNYKTEMVCFTVENDEHLYLMNDFIVTHNTAVLTERIKRILKEGADPTKMIAITFTNMAAQEMKKRLGEEAKGMFIGTFHSYANYICIMNNIDTSAYINNQQFDKIIEKALIVPKYRYPETTHIFVDEFQDVKKFEYELMIKINAENVFCVGDERQFIFNFAGSSDEYIKTMYLNTEYKKCFLTENYRCAPNIISYANGYVNSMETFSPSPTAIKTRDGSILKCSFEEALTDLTFSGDWGNWFICCRLNAEAATVQAILDKQKIPNIFFKKGDFETLEDIDSVLASNQVKILTIHSAKGLENKNVIVVGAKTFNEDERRICYVAATRAESSLYWCPTFKKKFMEQIGVTEPKRTASDNKIIKF